MMWADWMQWLVPALSAALTGSGIWALLGARAAARATEAAARATAAPAATSAATADWTALMSFWQGEMALVRADATRLEVRVLFLERQREEDLAYIAALEEHIWKELPPPPPARRRHSAGVTTTTTTTIDEGP